MGGKKIGKPPKGKKRTPISRSGRTVTPLVRVTPLSRRPRGGEKIRLAIATQPALLRDVLSRLLSREPDIEIVGQGHDEDRIVEVLKAVSPELLLLDYEALGPNSESIIARLRRIAPRTRILVMATRSADEYVERVLRAGAAGSSRSEDDEIDEGATERRIGTTLLATMVVTGATPFGLRKRAAASAGPMSGPVSEVSNRFSADARSGFATAAAIGSQVYRISTE